MPLNKNNTLYFTKEQKELADRNSSALDYALSQGYELVRKGSYYTMKEHDSMVFTPDGSWFWNSRGVHGRATEFIMEYEGRTLVEAVLTLAGESTPNHPQHYSPPPAQPKEHPELDSPNFELPTKSRDERQLFGYLCKTRKLSNQVVKEMIAQGILYQSDYVTHSGNTVHNACFVSFDDKGTPCSAFKRGLATVGTPYKGEVPGGDKDFGWVFHGRNPTKLYVFEAAIDAASFVSLGESLHKDPLAHGDYMALGGLTFTPVKNYLVKHPDVHTVHLMLDNDHGGRTAVERFIPHLQELGCQVEDHVPPRGKDWNEYLQSLHGRSPSRSQQSIAKSQRTPSTVSKDDSQPPHAHPMTLQKAHRELAAMPNYDKKQPPGAFQNQHEDKKKEACENRPQKMSLKERLSAAEKILEQQNVNECAKTNTYSLER